MVFYVNSIFVLVTAFLSVYTNHPIHAILYFILSALFLSVSIYLFGAPLAATMEVVIYAGAMMVLFVIVTMLIHHPTKIKETHLQLKEAVIPFFISALFVVELFWIFKDGSSGNIMPHWVFPSHVAELLMTRYAVGFELISFFLLAGIVGAFHMGTSKK